MTLSATTTGRLLATSDLHVSYPENRQLVTTLRPHSDSDWLIVAGDVGEFAADIEWALALLKSRFEQVIWTPGNHELWTLRKDPVQLRGEERYRYLVDLCRRIGVITPEDPYPVWKGTEGPVRIAPLFLLYDYTFRVKGMTTKEESLVNAQRAGIICTDEFLLYSDPYPAKDDWCRARLKETERRLSDCDESMPTILVNHYPLTRDPTRILYYPEFAQWCGTEHTADWHVRFRASVVVYGHLHIPRTTWLDGVRFEEVSVGYPREQRRHGLRRGPIRQILPNGHFPGAAS